jgi:hypothetical protein
MPPSEPRSPITDEEVIETVLIAGRWHEVAGLLRKCLVGLYLLILIRRWSETVLVCAAGHRKRTCIATSDEILVSASFVRAL